MVPALVNIKAFWIRFIRIWDSFILSVLTRRGTWSIPLKYISIFFSLAEGKNIWPISSISLGKSTTDSLI
jgi:hypothetical protein